MDRWVGAKAGLRLAYINPKQYIFYRLRHDLCCDSYQNGQQEMIASKTESQ